MFFQSPLFLLNNHIFVPMSPFEIFYKIINIIRKTKRFAIPERAVYFLKTKRTAGVLPHPKIFDRLTPVFT